MKRKYGTQTAKTFRTLFLLLFIIFAVEPRAYADEKTLIPVGTTVGITVSIKGVSVINTADFEGADGKLCSPAKDAGIQPGDRITKIDGREITSARELEKISGESKGKEITVEYDRSGNRAETKVKPETDVSDNKVRMGIWIKDSASGIGTMTFIDPKSGKFGALGHGICETDGAVVPIGGGRISNAEITSVQKGEKGVPGELVGIFSEDEQACGEVEMNTDNGIFGNIAPSMLAEFEGRAVPVANRDEVSEGEATVLSNIEGNKIREYSAEIVKINDDKDASKGMIVKITDSELIEKTGGIVRGMSGSPIIQNGKLVGAITHVFINNPVRGYGIFIEKMLNAA